MKVKAFEVPDIQFSRLPGEGKATFKVGPTETWSGLDTSEQLQLCCLSGGINSGVDVELGL